MEKKTAKLLKKRTARLQVLVQSFVAQHEAEHIIDISQHSPRTCQDNGRENQAFSETETTPRDVKSSCNHSHALPEVNKSNQRRKSVVDLIGRSFHGSQTEAGAHRRSSLSALRIGPSSAFNRNGLMASSFKSATHLNDNAACCTDLRALVDLVTAVEHLVDDVDEAIPLDPDDKNVVVEMPTGEEETNENTKQVECEELTVHM